MAKIQRKMAHKGVHNPGSYAKINVRGAWGIRHCLYRRDLHPPNPRPPALVVDYFCFFIEASIGWALRSPGATSKPNPRLGSVSWRLHTSGIKIFKRAARTARSMCARFRWPGGARAHHRHQLVGSGTPAQVKVETMFRELGWKII